MPRTPPNGKRFARKPRAQVRRASSPEPVGVAATAEAVLAAAPGGWQNRIVGEGWEEADQLLANSRNWRIHPKAQQDALSGVLDKVGWVQRVIVNKITGAVVDGHLRAALAISKGERVPVVYVDLSEDEEKLILATLDPLSAMAVKDDAALHDLISSMQEVYQKLAADSGNSLEDLASNMNLKSTIFGGGDPSADSAYFDDSALRNGGKDHPRCKECGRPLPRKPSASHASQ